MSENLKILTELILSFFACVGLVYLTHDFIFLISKSKKKTRAIVIVDLSYSPRPEREILNFALFYRTSHAERYIEKVIFTGAPDTLLEHSAELKEALRIPLEFDERN